MRGRRIDSQCSVSQLAACKEHHGNKHAAIEDVSITSEKSREQRRWRISRGELHWMTKRCMLGCLALAVAAVVGHHVYYTWLAGQVVGDALEQQKTRLYVHFPSWRKRSVKLNPMIQRGKHLPIHCSCGSGDVDRDRHDPIFIPPLDLLSYLRPVP